MKVATAAHSPGEEGVDIVGALFSGNERVFLRLVGEYHPLLELVARCALERSAAERLAKEFWSQALELLPSFDGRRPFKVWLLSLFFQMLDDARAKKTLVRNASQGLSYPELGPRSLVSPEDRLHEGTTAERLRAAIEALSFLESSVLILRDVGEWTPGEVKDLLGLTFETQRAVLHRARTTVLSWTGCAA